MLDFNEVKIDPLSSFLDEIERSGLGRPEIQGTGEIERFDTPSCKKGDKAGWLVLYLDGDIAAGAFGSWREGTSYKWHQGNVSDTIFKKIEKQIEQKTEKWTEKAKTAKEIWDSSPWADLNHPYLVKKGVKSHGIKQSGNKLVVPFCDTDGSIHSLQFISPDGDKKNLPGGEIKGFFHTIPGTTETIYLCEGYATGATIHEATGAQVVVAFDCGNLKVVAPKISGRVVVAADNDHKTTGNPGISAAKNTGLPFIFPQDIRGTDFNDMAVEQGLEAVRLFIQPPINKFDKRLIKSSELHNKFKESLNLSFVIKGILPESSGLVLIYGAPGSYKSFLALDIGLSISSGIDWHGNSVKKNRALYLAAEGQAGVLKRIEAWSQYHQIEIGNFDLLPMPCLVDNPGELSEFLNISRQLNPKVIFFDTLARSMLGDENSTLDMGKVVISCDRIRQETGAMVVLIHHTGKDETKGARGSIALTGATDTAFKVVKTKEYRQCIMICERQKDYDPFTSMVFSMEEVDTGFKTIDGDEVNSLVPVFDPGTKIKKKERVVPGKGVSIALKALQESLSISGVEPSEEIKNKMETYLPGDKVVHVDFWREMSYRMGIADSDDHQARKKAFKRSRETMLENEIVESFDDYFWVKK